MRSQSRLLAALGLLALAAFLPLGCGDLTALRPEKLSGPAWTEEQWPKLLDDLKGKLGENPRLLRVSAERHFATFEAQDPKKPENVDAWQFRMGVLEGPIPVQLIGDGELEPSLFSWNEVALDKIPELCRLAVEKLALEGGEVVGVDVQRHFDPSAAILQKAREMHADLSKQLGEEAPEERIEEQGAIQIKITVHGTRKMGGLHASANGEVQEVRTY